MKRRYSLRSKLSLSYVFVALISLFLISVITNLLLEGHFKDYIIEKHEQGNRELVALVSQYYAADGSWNTGAIEKICLNALGQGKVIRVVDAAGKVIWDARLHDNTLCQQIIAQMARNMTERYPKWQGGYVEDGYPVISGGREVGRVEIGYYGPYYYNDLDLEFINSINRLLVGVGIFALFLSLLVGGVMAKSLSTPIARVITTAQMIAKGYYQGRAGETTNIHEIAQLTTAINHLAETLERQEALRKRLTSDVAHELRTPLATLQSSLEAMMDGIWQPDPERLKSCHEEILRLNRLVEDLAQLTRYESENLILAKTAFDLSALCRGIIKNVEAGFRQKGITLRFFGEEETVFADKDKISQVLINLLSNAEKYTPPGGEVEVEVRGGTDFAELRVKDSGIGIKPEDLPYIFERFYRADQSRNRLTGGAGIGLTIAKGIVEAHGGRIIAQSEVGQGTEFIVLLPKAENPGSI